MYRQFLTVLLCQLAASAPKAVTDSDVTYVKLRPPIDTPLLYKHRESRIENLPLTIPGIVTLERTQSTEQKKHKQDDQDIIDNLSDSNYDIIPESSDIAAVTALPDDESLAPISKDIPEIKIVKTVENEEQTENPELFPSSEVKDDLQDKPELDDTIPADTNLQRRGRNFESGETTDIFEDQTERYEELTQITEAPKVRPKFSPKSSYFKPQVFSYSTNSLEKSTKRRFRSNCRCERIWNCPKLQISVPRCPNEYFLCCF